MAPVAFAFERSLVCALGRERLVTANPKQLARARASLQQLEDLWRCRLEALDEVLSE
jgi:hypothetical protein